MQKDLKIGMVFGLVLTAVAAVWLSTRQSLSVKSRMLQSVGSASQQKPTAEQPHFIMNLSDTSHHTTALNAETISPTEQAKASTAAKSPRKQTENSKPQRFHIVRRGETLSSISFKYYGTANKWQKILDANRKVITDVNRIMPETKLIIPE